MDAARYARIRELFLAAEELSAENQQAYLREQTGDDSELLQDVLSLLDEHDSELAKQEGECAIQVPNPPGISINPSSPTTRGQAFPTTSGSTPAKSIPSRGDTTRRGDSSGATHESSGSRKKDGGLITKQAQRTHASPRYKDEKPNRTQKTAGSILWADRNRKQRRRTSGWLWLAALLPTALIGWWTYRQVDSAIEQSIQGELQGVLDSLALGSDRYLHDKAQLVQSWSRQPSIRQAVVELVKFADGNPSLDELRQAPQIDLIHSQLRELSGVDDIKFVLWDDSSQTLASWLPDRADVGNRVHPTGAANVLRVLSGETVLFGPERLNKTTIGFVPETTRPVVAVIVPIFDNESQVVAALLVRGFRVFDELNQVFKDVAVASDLDVYAINRDSLMVTESPHALSLSIQGRLELTATDIAANLKVADPGIALNSKNIATLNRQIRPITYAAAGATSGKSEVRTTPYPNYAGEDVVGAWRWLEDWNLGVVVEKNASQAFEAARIVRFGFLTLGTLLALTASIAAAKIARTSAAEHAAVHPLSRYEILGELGSGGMGHVFRARHRQLGRDTALKVLRGDRHNKEDRLRFDREARLAASLSNPHSVMIYDYGHSDEGEAFCVMELLRGLTLQETVSRSGHQPIGRVLFIVRQICDALTEAHATNLLHRDVKPQNVMLSLDPSVGDWAVVFDYGLAKPLQPDAGVYQTSETIWSGTPMYMAPERFRDPSGMDPRSDIYSVGCVAYYLLAGRPPFAESDPESLFALILSEHPIGIGIHRNEEVPQEITDLVFKCMAKRADDRFATIEEVSRVIDQLRVKHGWSVDDARVWWKLHGGS